MPVLNPIVTMVTVRAVILCLFYNYDLFLIVIVYKVYKEDIFFQYRVAILETLHFIAANLSTKPSVITAAGVLPSLPAVELGHQQHHNHRPHIGSSQVTWTTTAIHLSQFGGGQGSTAVTRRLDEKSTSVSLTPATTTIRNNPNQGLFYLRS
jgi:hypothetical protein